MPVEIDTINDIKIGEIYEDSFYHPCLCMGKEDGAIWGISLIDGSHPRCEDVGVSGIRKLTPSEAWEWRINGPQDVELSDDNKWWA